MRVLDAGVVVELLVAGLDPARLGSEDLAAPHLIDSEVTHVLRGLTTRGAITEAQAARAMQGFIALSIERFPADWLRPGMWELRHNFTGYDATYVALTEPSRQRPCSPPTPASPQHPAPAAPSKSSDHRTRVPDLRTSPAAEVATSGVPGLRSLGVPVL